MKWSVPLALSTIIVLIAGACSVKPLTLIPSSVGISQLLTAIESSSTQVTDFSGKVRIRILRKDTSHYRVTGTVRYIRPHLLRIVVKGVGGTPFCLISADNDSVTMWFPSDNVFFRVGRESGRGVDDFSTVMKEIIPDINIDVEHMEYIFSGIMPHHSELRNYEMTFKNHGRRAIVVLKQCGTVLRFTLEGSSLRLIGEEIVDDGRTVWEKTSSSFRHINGIEFPIKATIEMGNDTYMLEFSDMYINNGLTEKDVLFTVPPTVERVAVEE